MTDSIRNAQINHGIMDFTLMEDDLDVIETEALSYLRGLEAVKANAVALARFAPEAVDGLRAAHAGFGRTVEENRIVLATARAVSEGLIKSLSEEITRVGWVKEVGAGAWEALILMGAGRVLVGRVLVGRRL